MTFAGDDYGLFIFAKTILAKNSAVCLTFFYNCDSPEEAYRENVSLWDRSMNPYKDKKVGIMSDHHNYTITAWAKAQTEASYFPTQALHHLANEGLADSVEFRRLARKFIRRAKEHNCEVLFFPEMIFAETKTQKILQHLAGSQMKIQTCNHESSGEIKTTLKQEITIYHQLESVEFLKLRAEKLLGTKLKSSDFVKK